MKGILQPPPSVNTLIIFNDFALLHLFFIKTTSTPHLRNHPCLSVCLLAWLEDSWRNYTLQQGRRPWWHQCEVLKTCVSLVSVFLSHFYHLSLKQEKIAVLLHHKKIICLAESHLAVDLIIYGINKVFFINLRREILFFHPPSVKTLHLQGPANLKTKAACCKHWMHERCTKTYHMINKDYYRVYRALNVSEWCSFKT